MAKRLSRIEDPPETLDRLSKIDRSFELARRYHSKGDMKLALTHYREASGLGHPTASYRIYRYSGKASERLVYLEQSMRQGHIFGAIRYHAIAFRTASGPTRLLHLIRAFAAYVRGVGVILIRGSDDVRVEK